MKTFSLLAGLLLLAVVPGMAGGVRFTFAVPEFEGRVSLGVFDASGKLVRILARQAPESSFIAGLDGLIAPWDGRNDAGEPVPPGTYAARGYFVGNAVKSEGIAFHFNDWIESEDSPPVVDLAVSGISGDVLHLTGHLLRPGTSGEQVALTYSDKLEIVPSSAEEAEPPSAEAQPFSWQGRVLIQGPERELLVSDGRSVSARASDLPQAIPVEDDLRVRFLFAGNRENFWMIARHERAGIKSPVFVRQYSFRGELLRQLTNAFDAESLCAAANSESLYLMSRLEAGALAVRGLRPLASESRPAGEPVDWEIFFEKSSQECANFGLVAGQLVPDAGQAAQSDKVSIQLASSTFLPQGGRLPLRAGKLGEVVWLVDEKDIPVYPVSTLRDAGRFVLEGGKSGLVTAYIGNGAVVAEYEIKGLGQIAPIDAGETDVR